MWEELAYQAEAILHTFRRVLREELNRKCKRQPPTRRCLSLITSKSIPMSSIQTPARWTRLPTLNLIKILLPFVKKEGQLACSCNVWPNRSMNTRGRIKLLITLTPVLMKEVSINLLRCLRYRASKKFKLMQPTMWSMQMCRETRSLVTKRLMSVIENEK